MLYGVHDHWIDPAAGKWEYTYHERLFAYQVPGAGAVDQVAAVIAKLRQVPYTRRAQVVTWQVWNDLNIGDTVLRWAECRGWSIAMKLG